VNKNCILLLAGRDKTLFLILLFFGIFVNAFAQNPFDPFVARVPIHFDSTTRRPEKIIRDERHWLSFWIKVGSCNFNLEIESQAQCKNPKIKTGAKIQIARMIQTENQSLYELMIDHNQIECMDPISIQAASGNLTCSPRKTEIEIQNEIEPYFAWADRRPARAQSNFLIHQIKKRFMPAQQ
jgi:hypothetical protein